MGTLLLSKEYRKEVEDLVHEKIKSKEVVDDVIGEVFLKIDQKKANSFTNKKQLRALILSITENTLYDYVKNTNTSGLSSPMVFKKVKKQSKRLSMYKKTISKWYFRNLA